VFDAGWAPIIRRSWEFMISALPVVLLLGVVPLAFVPDFRHLLWEWTDVSHVLPSGHEVGHDPILKAKSWFLNENFFLIRIFAYVVFFGVITWVLRNFSFKQDKDRSAKYTHTLHAVSAAGIPLSAVLLTMLAFDCLMALSYHWFSTMYGVWFFALSIRLALADYCDSDLSTFEWWLARRTSQSSPSSRVGLLDVSLHCFLGLH
jgi:hypothetical protein